MTGRKHQGRSFSALLADLALATVAQMTENLCVGAYRNGDSPQGDTYFRWLRRAAMVAR